MSSFTNFNHSTEHAGLARVTSGMGVVGQWSGRISGARALATLLLSALAAAILVVAYQVMDSVAEGHLLVLWMAMWLVAFVVLALFAGTLRKVSARLAASLDDWSRSLAEARSDQRLWATAKRDPRVMADLQMAMLREEARAEAGAATAPAAAVVPSKAERVVRLGSSILRAYQRNYLV